MLVLIRCSFLYNELTESLRVRYGNFDLGWICYSHLFYEVVEMKTLIVLHGNAKLVASLWVKHEDQLFPEALEE